MIDFCYWVSANTQKVRLFMEEANVPHRLVPVDVTAGDQFEPAFVRIAPNSKLPVIVDHEPAGGGDSVIVFESGAILLYLAEKTGRFLSSDPRTRMTTIQWLFWQMAGLGPISGQAVHFRNYAPEPVDYALKRFGAELDRLVGVLDQQLAERAFIAGEYSIADMACYPWIVAHHRREQIDLDRFANVGRWFRAIGERPAVPRAYSRFEEILGGPLARNRDDFTRAQRRLMFGAHAVTD